MRTDEAIAVVGMGGLFPGAEDTATLWANICSKKDATREVDKDRWIAPPVAMLSGDLQPDKAYSARCCLLPEFRVDPHELNLPSDLLSALDPLHLLALRAGRQAVSGDHPPRLNREKTGVILAALVLPTDSSSSLTRRIFGRILEDAACRGESSIIRPQEIGPHAYFATRVASLPAALLTEALGLGGGSYTLDAACASSLYAVKLACDELQSGRADAMLAGGVSRPDSLFTQVGFSQLRALSPSGRCAPFDRSADGLVVGEGVGILVLKRLSDALRDGDGIWGLIRGIGISNDLRGNLLAPDSEGQLRAMRSAYSAAGWSPQDVDFIECHGAGTPVGDKTELSSLQSLWGASGWIVGSCPLGSIKSMIGHLLTAAGAAGVIKTLMAMKHGILPPTLHFRQAAVDSPLNGGPFRVQTEPELWTRRQNGQPRRAAVSAFGFGGINAHLLLEEWSEKEDGQGAGRARRQAPAEKRADNTSELSTSVHSAIRIPDSLVAIVGMSVCFGRVDSLDEFREAVFKGKRLAGPRPKGRWKGCDDALPHLGGLQGCFLDEIAFPGNEFHMPPKEIDDILPQQLLMLKVAANAMNDAGMPLRAERPRMAALMGIAFDFEASNFHLRWYLESVFPQWRRSCFPQISDKESSAWLRTLKEACAPPLTASRTLGALGSMVASRIAREFRFGGASFVVSAEEASGLRALEIGVRALQAGALDSALIGAVEIGGDLRLMAAESTLWPDFRGDSSHSDRKVLPTTPGEGAAAIVIKRLEQAIADGDRVYAVVSGIGSASGGGVAAKAPSRKACVLSLERAIEEAGDIASHPVLYDAHVNCIGTEGRLQWQEIHAWSERNGIELDPGSVKTAIGRTGAVSGLASVVKNALCMHHGFRPPGISNGRLCGRRSDRANHSRRSFPVNDERPRWAVSAVMTADGNCMHVVLEASQEPKHRVMASDALQPEPDRNPAPHAHRTRPDTPIRVPVGGSPIVPLFLSHTPQSSRILPGPAAMDVPSAAESLIRQIATVSEAVASAHRGFLDATTEMTRNYADALGLHSRLVELAAAGTAHAAAAPEANGAPPPTFDRNQCLEFARGSAAQVLGPEFAEVDTFGARVRLPDEPLMLVDRILEVSGEKGSLGPGRIITEHDVRPGAWYLIGGRAPVCISVEAGQADLFLCAWLGIDLVVRGRRTYRLLDASVEFHRELPQPGEIIRYVIEIEKFLRQGDTYLFLFSFTGSINNTPLITMTNGCAGFFTREEIENSGGIILTDEEKQPLPGKLPDDWRYPLPLAAEHYDDDAVDALRGGDLASAFGDLFREVRIAEALRLPGGRMRLIDRILALQPLGGRYGLGRIRAEADIHPDDWFLTCHFVDDMVMPGTLMYECCTHALQVLIQRIGWVSESPDAHYEPLPSVKATLRCRGPVTPETRHVIYEVDVKQLGYGPQPFVIADANMYADGRHIVRFSDMSLQLTGVTRIDIEDFWDRRSLPGNTTPAHAESQPLFRREQLLAFARGKPSAAFGEPYRPFDTGRFIARLPSPPYLFMDRVTRVEPQPWVVQPDGWVEAEYDIPVDAWHVAADRSGSVPYCVLLEAALQPCGWLAAYMGSALKSDKPLLFRNLGGHGVLHRTLAAGADTLRVRTRMTQASQVTDMLIEHFDFEIYGARGLIYDGSTYFGFFTRSALKRQQGIREARHQAIRPAADTTAPSEFVFEDAAPHTPDDPQASSYRGLVFPSSALRMIDRIDLFLPQGGPQGLGFVQGSKQIDPQEWFFHAHFYQDPVCPGSLGLESFLQLLKFAAVRRWPQLVPSHRFVLATGERHRWTYRGQIVPSHRQVTVEAEITRAADAPYPALFADGCLMVDGLYIYRMEGFGIRLVPLP